MPRPARELPEALSDGWPHMPSADPIGEVARQFALNVEAAIGERSVRAAARDVGVDHATIRALIAGKSWPDLATIAKLERGFGVNLWPGLLGTPE
ncbi:MAG: helix-turn-helix transcriptional regulator [Mycetocola sp.]